MKALLVYENLDTSFVNLSALVRFLRAKDFIGEVNVELGEYTGTIVFTAEKEMRVHERDRASGRSAEGEDALQRLLIRAREAGGIINVSQTASEQANGFAKPKNSKVFGSGESFPADISTPVRIFQPSSLPETRQFIEKQSEFNKDAENAVYNAQTNLNTKTSELPFEFSNSVETKARQNQFSETEWQTFLQLIEELLRTIDDSLAKNNLNFAAAFQKASAETANDYPFLAPNSGFFAYQNGKIEMGKQIGVKIFAAAINETLRRILEKLAANPKFADSHRDTSQKILALVRRHKSLYDKFFITPQLEKILGV